MSVIDGVSFCRSLLYYLVFLSSINVSALSRDMLFFHSPETVLEALTFRLSISSTMQPHLTILASYYLTVSLDFYYLVTLLIQYVII